MPNSKIMLITRPFYDPPTTYLFNWSEDIINFAKQNGITVIDLKQHDANRKNLESRIKSQDPKLVVFNGHGSSDRVTGFSIDHVLVKCNDNEDILSYRIVYSISCESAKELGPKCVEKDTEAFIGFEEGFAFLHEKSWETNPKKDKKAAIFLNIINSIPINLIKGNSAGDVVEKCKNAFEKQIEYFTANYNYDTQHILAWLKWDKEILKLHGNINALL